MACGGFPLSYTSFEGGGNFHLLLSSRFVNTLFEDCANTPFYVLMIGGVLGLSSCTFQRTVDINRGDEQ
jgi:hypothetical protein